MDQKQFDALLSDAETRLRRLKVLYEQWFMGIERVEPGQARKDFEDLLARMRKEQTNNTAQRFRLQQLVQRHVTLSTHWRRVGRQIEEGTYQRDLLRAKRRKRTGQAREADEPDIDVTFDVDIDDDLAAALAEADRLAHEPADPKAYPAPLMAAGKRGGTVPGIAPSAMGDGVQTSAASGRPPMPPDLGPSQHSLTPFAVPGANTTRSRSIPPSSRSSPPPLTAAVTQASSSSAGGPLAPPIGARGVGATPVRQVGADAGPSAGRGSLLQDAGADVGSGGGGPATGRGSLVQGADPGARAAMGGPPMSAPGAGRASLVQGGGVAAGSPPAGGSAPSVSSAARALDRSSQVRQPVAIDDGAPARNPDLGRPSAVRGHAAGGGGSAPGVSRASDAQSNAASGGASTPGASGGAGVQGGMAGAGATAGGGASNPGASRGAVTQGGAAGAAFGGGVSAPSVGRASVVHGGGQGAAVGGGPGAAGGGRAATAPGVGRASVAQGGHSAAGAGPSAAQPTAAASAGAAARAAAAQTGAARAPMSPAEAFGAGPGGRSAAQRPAAPARTSPGHAPAARPAASAAQGGGPGFSSTDIDRVYNQYVAARGKNAERTDNVKRETIEKTIRGMLPGLEQKHAGKKIDFEVVVKDGRVALKPVAK